MQPREGPLTGIATSAARPPRRAVPAVEPRINFAGRFGLSQYRVLLGRMLEQGHGAEAVCFFLKLGRDALSDLIVHFDLPTPHDRPLRRSGGVRAWTQGDFTLLLDGWLNNWSAGCIGDQLGRSRGSIWCQARRLGLPKRERKALHWPRQTIIETPPAPRPSPGRKRLPERWFVRGADKVFELTSKRGGLEVDWAGNIEAYADIGWRAFSGQRISRIAEDYGVSCGTITSQIWWLHAKTPRSQKDCVDGFDRARGQATAKAMGFQLRQCSINNIFPFFFCKKEQVARRDKRNSKRGGMDF